jgi:16S rRNA (cytidine1402-2'-O)-methyltransferase
MPLTLCPTPIGNLDDVTERQRAALSGADIIACEDTRRTGKLLELLGIERVEGHPALRSYHEHNAEDRRPQLLAELRDGASVTLVSDAGTPCISDPGYRLVRDARDEGLAVTALPGPFAGLVALVASGLPTDRFVFCGFPPASSSARRTHLEEQAGCGATTVHYESPHRVVALLDDIATTCGPDHPVCVARELTKMHEEYLRGAASELADELRARGELRGEFVVVCGPVEAGEGASVDWDLVDAHIDRLLGEGVRTKALSAILSELHPVSKTEVYQRVLERSE